MKNRLKKFICLGVLIIALVVIDQISKYLVSAKLNHHKNYSVLKYIFSFEYLENRGVAFGILSGKMYLITAFVIIVTIVIIFGIYILEKAIENNRNKKDILKKFTLLQVICSFLIAGSIGNMIDRIRFGYVIDFIKFDFIDFPTFNIADCYVTIAAAILFVTLMFFISEEDFNSLKFRK